MPMGRAATAREQGLEVSGYRGFRRAGSFAAKIGYLGATSPAPMAGGRGELLAREGLLKLIPRLAGVIARRAAPLLGFFARTPTPVPRVPLVLPPRRKKENHDAQRAFVEDGQSP